MSGKTSFVIATLVLSTALWIGAYIAPPRVPLQASETLAVVAISALLVLAVQWLWRRLRRCRALAGDLRPEGAVMPSRRPRGQRALPGLLTIAVCAVCSVACRPPGIAASSAADLRHGPPVVACSPAKMSVVPGEKLDLEAWAGPGKQDAYQYRWKVTAGEIVGSGPKVRWHLAGVSVGYHSASVELAGTAVTCTLSVRVVEGSRGAGRLSGRTLLVRGERQSLGYGLYSYLLLPVSPTGTVLEERYREAIKAYVALMPAIEEFQSQRLIKHLNLTVLTVTRAIDPGLHHSELPEWLLANYDHARAQELLLAVPGDQRLGPYLVSTPAPLTAEAPPDRFLFQNLSLAPPHLVRSWVQEFLHQSEQEEDWSDHDGGNLLFRLRTTIGALGEAVPAVAKGVDELIRLFDRTKESSAAAVDDHRLALALREELPLKLERRSEVAGR